MGSWRPPSCPRVRTSPADYNIQLAAWLPRANSRMLRRTEQHPGHRVGADVAAMGALPPITPSVGTTERVRLGRDYYLRIAGNDYSVDPVLGVASELPAALLARLLGITISVAVAWQRASAGDQLRRRLQPQRQPQQRRRT